MSWYIDVDEIDDGYAVDAYNGGGNLDYTKRRCNHRFRMLDDDGMMYYKGYSDDSSSFEPLDDFGMPNAGCTDIQYWENGKWESL